MEFEDEANQIRFPPHLDINPTFSVDQLKFKYLRQRRKRSNQLIRHIKLDTNDEQTTIRHHIAS
jgi:hypothetical protein